MSDKAFARAMYQIANEAEVEQQRELQAAERRKFWGKVRRTCVFTFGMIALGSAVYFRADLERYASKLGGGGSPKISGETAAALNDLRTHAAKRDSVLEEISSK